VVLEVVAAPKVMVLEMAVAVVAAAVADAKKMAMVARTVAGTTAALEVKATMVTEEAMPSSAVTREAQAKVEETRGLVAEESMAEAVLEA